MRTGTVPMTEHQKVSCVKLSTNLTQPPGVWRQWNGAPLSWTPWWGQNSDGTNEPDGGNKQNCAVISLRSSAWAGKWWSNHCTDAFHYICEK